MEIFKIFRHIAHEPVRANHRSQKPLHHFRLFFENAAGGCNDPLRPAVGILLLQSHQRIETFFLKFFGFPHRHRRAVNFSCAQCVDIDRVIDSPHELDITVRIETRLVQPNGDTPMAVAAEIADANFFAFQSCSDLICGGLTQT